MEFNLIEGILIEKEIKVTEKELAINIGSGDLEVYGTPAMIALMENAAKSLVSGDLPNGFSTVGIEMNVKHIKSSKVGSNIKCKATLIKVDGKKLFFEVEAKDDIGIIGAGEHIRYIVNNNDFMKKTNNN